MSAKGVLPEFQKFLLTHKLAQEKHVLFLAVWVSKFLAFSNRKGHQDLGLTVMEFLKSLETKEDEVSRYLLFDRLSPVAHQALLFIVKRGKLRSLLFILPGNQVF